MSKSDGDLKHALKRAALELCCGDGNLKQRLSSAIRALDRFLGRREAWPAASYARMQDISDELKSAGAVEPAIDSMGLSEMQQLAERILRLYADCHAPSGPR